MLSLPGRLDPVVAAIAKDRVVAGAATIESSPLLPARGSRAAKTVDRVASAVPLMESLPSVPLRIAI